MESVWPVRVTRGGREVRGVVVVVVGGFVEGFFVGVVEEGRAGEVDQM